ncbi:MAG: SH3 domain-containing protein [Gemmatimonadetes bacterium]|nr:SH3 domain-containing protein [Gemmatimonadota bacterium]
MRRVTCAACGAPSVLGASRCPKCLAPFGGESPTSGVVLVEPPPRAGGAPDVRRWLSLVLGALGVVGVGALLWSTRDRDDAVSSGATAPAPEPAEVVPTAIDTSRSPGPIAPAPVAGADVRSGTTSGAVVTAPPRAPRAAPASPSGDAGTTFTFETLTWVRLRTAPSVEAEVLATLAPGTRVEVSAIGRGWLTARWEGQVGWVGASLLTRVR